MPWSFRRVGRKVWLVVFFVLAGAGLYLMLAYNPFDPEARALRRQEKLVKEMEEKYRTDPYGGSTPEETLQLFIDALKKGDTDLAAKYFIIDKQEEWRADLSKIAERNLLGEMVRDLENRKSDKILDTEARYFLMAADGLSSPLVLIKSINGRWKIRTL